MEEVRREMGGFRRDGLDCEREWKRVAKVYVWVMFLGFAFNSALFYARVVGWLAIYDGERGRGFVKRNECEKWGWDR